MHDAQDFETRVQAAYDLWVEEMPTDVDALALVRATRVPAHRPTLRTRFLTMHASLKIAAVAVLALAIGIGVGPLLTPKDSIGPGASPSPAPSPVLLPTSGTLDQGSYYVDGTLDTAPDRVTFSVPAGWVPFHGGIASNGVPVYPAPGWEGGVGLDSWLVTHVFTDACHHATLVDAGTTVEGLTTALLAQQGVVTSGPTDVTLAGYPAKHVELTVPSDLDLATCEDGVIRFWPGPGPDMGSGMCCTFGPGATVALDIVDLEGHRWGRWVVVAWRGPEASADQLAALDGVLASIRIASPSSGGPGHADMAPGRHAIPESNTDGVGKWPVDQLIVTVPSGWVQAATAYGGGITKGKDAYGEDGKTSAQGGIRFGRLGSLQPGPGDCPRQEVPGPTVGDLVTSLQAIADAWPAGTGPGLEVSDLVIAGYAGKRVDFTIPDGDLGCRGLFGWSTPEGGEQWRASWEQGQHRQLSILDIEGVRFVIDAWYSADAAPEVRTEVQAVVDSVELARRRR